MATIFEKQTVTFYPDDSYGGLCTLNLGSGSLTEGESYDVYFDGQKYICIAEPMMLDTLSGIGLGNKTIVGIGEDTGEPFIIGNAYGMLVCILNETEESAHEMAIYRQAIAEEPEEPQGVVLKNYHGTDITYEDVNYVKLRTSDGGTQLFSKGEAIENVPVELDFTNGDQTIIAEDGTFIKSAIIEMPATLTEDNIRIHKTIAGITGTFIGDGEEKTIDNLNFAGGSIVVEPSGDKLFSTITIQKPENLVPANIAANVEIAGIVGTYQGGGGGNAGDNGSAYLLVTFGIEKIIVHKVWYEHLYQDTGKYDVEIPDEINGFPVYINSLGV